MPWKLVPPHTRKDGKEIRFYYIRGKYLGIRLDDSTGATEEKAAKTIFTTWKRQAERGEFRRKPVVEESPRTFVSAALAYINAGGDGYYLDPIIQKWRDKPVEAIDQIAIDTLAEELYPGYPASTKNRQFYTPVSAVLKHVGVERKIKRPKGWRGKKSQSWLEFDGPVQKVIEAAYQIEYEFGLLCHHLAYTGQRIGEVLSLTLRQLWLPRSFLYLGDSKNGDPRGIHLPPHLVEAYRAAPPRSARNLSVKGRRWRKGEGGRSPADAGTPFLKRDPDAKLFRFHYGSALRKKLARAIEMAGYRFPKREGGLHLFCHTYGTGMSVYGKLDGEGLTRTGRWKSVQSTGRYRHSRASEEAKRADLLPAPKRGQVVDIKSKAG